jgi:hypothetical protein
MPELSPAAQLKKSKSKAEKPLAILVMTNQGVIQANSEQAEAFYVEVETLLRSKGFRVRRDPGEENTQPEDADIWVGHGTGCTCISNSGAPIKLFIKSNDFTVSDKIKSAIDQLGDKLKGKSQVKKLIQELIKDIISKG